MSKLEEKERNRVVFRCRKEKGPKVNDVSVG